MLIHLFYIHALHRMIKAARQGRDKNGVLQSAMVSQFGHLCSVVTLSWRGSSNQPISFLKHRRDIALHMAEALCAMGEEVSVASAIQVPCILKRAYKTGIAALSVAIPCASQKIVMCIIWAVHKLGPVQCSTKPAVQQWIIHITISHLSFAITTQPHKRSGLFLCHFKEHKI